MGIDLKIEENDIIGMEIVRLTGGIRLDIISSEIEELCKQLSECVVGKSTMFLGDLHHYKGKKWYRFPEDFPKFEGMSALNTERTLKMHKGTVPNVSYLRRVGLSEGKSITIPGLYTDDDIKDYHEMARIRIVEFIQEGKKYLAKRSADTSVAEVPVQIVQP